MGTVRVSCDIRRVVVDRPAVQVPSDGVWPRFEPGPMVYATLEAADGRMVTESRDVRQYRTAGDATEHAVGAALLALLKRPTATVTVEELERRAGR